MSVALGTIDFTLANVGSKYTLDLSQLSLPTTSFYASASQYGTLQVFNDSGCGLAYQFQRSHNSGQIPAGGWRNLLVDPGETGVNLQVIYTLPNPPVSSLMATYFAPNEPVPDIGTLGNSPVGIGGSVSTSSVQTLSNEGGARGLLVIDIGDLAISQLIQIYSDHFSIAVDQSGVGHTVLQGKTTGNPLLIGQAGDIAEVLGKLTVDQVLTAVGGMNANTIRDNSTGASQISLATAGITIVNAVQSLLTLAAGLSITGGTTSLDNGAITTDGAGNITALTAITALLNASGGLKVNHAIDLTPDSTQLVGGTSGNVTAQQIFKAGVFKLVGIYWNNYQDAGSHPLSLPTAFSSEVGFGFSGGIGSQGGNGGMQLMQSGVAQSCQVLTSLPSTNPSAGTTYNANNLYQFNLFQCINPVNQINVFSNTGSHTGWVYLFGH